MPDVTDGLEVVVACSSHGKSKIQEVAQLILGAWSNVTAEYTDDLC